MCGNVMLMTKMAIILMLSKILLVGNNYYALVGGKKCLTFHFT